MDKNRLLATIKKKDDLNHCAYPNIPIGGIGMIGQNTKDKLLPRIRRVEGQVRGIEKMVQNDEYCIDVINQINAARRALEKVALHLIQQHMKTCVTDAIEHKKGDVKIQEMVKTLDHFLR